MAAHPKVRRGKTKELQCDAAEFGIFKKGGTPHVIFQSPASYKTGDLIKVVEVSNGAVTGRDAGGQVISVTLPGHSGLPSDIGVVSVSYLAIADVGSRLFGTLRGHYLELEAAFARSATHKLPGSKGRLREHAVSKFLGSWMPSRYRPFCNVFFSHDAAGLFDNEVDLVLYDAQEGAHWALDGNQANWMLDWMHVKAVFEVKSTLTKYTWSKAIEEISAVLGYAKTAAASNGKKLPLTVLFAYKIESSFKDQFEELLLISHPFDIIILLEGEAHLSKRLATMAYAFMRRLTFEGGNEDLLVANATLSADIAMDIDGYLRIGESPEDTLLALVYVCTEECAGSNMTLSLLKALGVAGTVKPLYDPSTIDLPSLSEAPSGTEVACDLSAEFESLISFADGNDAKDKLS